MKKIFKSFALVTAAATFTRLLSFAFKIYLSRALGAEILGVYQIAVSVIATLACVGSSGIPVTLSRMTAENAALGKRRESDSLLLAATTLSLTFALLACAVFCAFPSLTSSLFSDERCVPVFYILLPLLATAALYSCLRGWFWGNKNYGVYAATELADEITKILFTVILLSGTLAVVNFQLSYAYAMVASDVFVVVMLAVLFFVCGGRIRRPLGFAPVVKSSFPLTMTRLSGSLVTTLVSLTLPAMLVRSLGIASGEATAELGRATGMVMPLLFAPAAVTGSLAVVVIPEFASLNAGNERDRIGNALSLAIKYSCIATGFFFALFASCGVALGGLLYADEKAGQYVCVAALAMLPMGANGLCVSALNSLGKENSTFASHIVGLVVLLGVLFSFVWFAGIYAYFAALALSHAVTLAINLKSLSKQVRLDRKPLFQSLFAYAFCCIAALSLSPLSSLVADKAGNAVAVLATAAVIVVFYPVYLVVSGTVSKADLRLVASGSAAKRGAK